MQDPGQPVGQGPQRGVVVQAAVALLVVVGAGTG